MGCQIHIRSAGDLKGQDPQGKEVRFDDINQALAGTYEEFKRSHHDGKDSLCGR
jgi:hypothetical protein